MIVVSNASPLISLAKIGCLHLLPDLFGEISITPQVHHEIVGHGSKRPGATAVQNAAWVRIQPVTDIVLLQQWGQIYRLGPGELATVLLARELGADLAIIDERAARLLAARHNVRVMGCVGVLEAGYQKGGVPDLRALYQQLLSHGVRIDREILNHSLAALNLPHL